MGPYPAISLRTAKTLSNGVVAGQCRDPSRSNAARRSSGRCSRSEERPFSCGREGLDGQGTLRRGRRSPCATSRQPPRLRSGCFVVTSPLDESLLRVRFEPFEQRQRLEHDVRRVELVEHLAARPDRQPLVDDGRPRRIAAELLHHPQSLVRAEPRRVGAGPGSQRVLAMHGSGGGGSSASTSVRPSSSSSLPGAGSTGCAGAVRARPSTSASVGERSG